MNKWTVRSARLAMAGLTLVIAAGCNTTHAEHKKQANDRWTAARAGVMYGVAVQQFETGDFEKAKRTIASVLSVAPDHAKFNILAARIALEQNNLERAYRHLELATENDPKAAEAHYLSGVILQRWQRHEAAMASYLAAYEADPESDAGLIAAGETLSVMGRNDDAIALMSEKLIYFEHSAALRMAIGRIHMKQRRFDQAIDMFNEAYVLASDDPSVLEQLAMAEYAAGRFADATFHLKRLLRDDEAAERRDLRIALGDCYQITERHVDAREIFLQLVREDETDVQAWIKLGQAARIVGDIRRLQEAAHQVVALEPNRHEGYILMGMYYQKTGRFEQAVAQYEQASRHAPDSALPHILKGLTFEESGDRNAAATAYEAALRAQPDDARARQLLVGVTNDPN